MPTSTPPTPPPTRTTPMLRLDGLGRRFGDRWAVRDLDLEVRRGEVLGLLGPNGAGKTTTVRLLAALIAPSAGRAWLDGIEVTADPEAVRARTGLLTESPGLYDRLSAEANLDFFGRLHRLPAPVRRERIARSLELFGLTDRRREAAGTFSKGMRQKLAIARALLHEPTVVFLDEPTAALDPEAAFVVREAIASLRGQGRTIVLCTHNLDEADRLCDRIAFIRGSLLRVDAPARLRGELAGTGVRVRLARSPEPGLLAALARLPGVVGVDAADGLVDVTIEDLVRATPTIVRTLVGGGADVLEVRPRAASLEQVYFDVMGVRPGRDGEVE